MHVLENDRIIIRKMRVEDLETLFDYRNHKACYQYQRYGDTSKESLLKLIAKSEQSDLDSLGNHYYAIAKKEDDQIIGDLFIAINNEVITLGYTISYVYQRQGYALSTLSSLIEKLHEHFPIHEMVGMVHKDNIGSIRLLDKLGFIDEGYEPKVDSLIFSKYTKKQ